MFVTSRLHIDLEEKFANIYRVEIRASYSDIEAYLKSEIKTNSRLSKFTAKYPKLEEEIMTSVNEKAAGM